MRSAAKLLVVGLVFVTMVPVLLMYLIGRVAMRLEPFAAFSQWFALYPGKLGSYSRVLFLVLTTPTSAIDSRIGFGTVFSQRDTEIGDGVYIGPQCNIGSCAIGSQTLVASGVHILSGSRQHGTASLEVPMQQQRGVYRKISIGRDCWIGNGAIVMEDIGDQCIVGAGAVVTKPLPRRAIAVGNPARIIGTRGEHAA